MEKDYVKVKKVSLRLTGEPSKIRTTTPRFKSLIKECNETIESILNAYELNDKQEKQAERMGL